MSKIVIPLLLLIAMIPVCVVGLTGISFYLSLLFEDLDASDLSDPVFWGDLFVIIFSIFSMVVILSCLGLMFYYTISLL